MSKLSIYETSWANLVFENRNKDYGAYKLRQESTKTSLRALFIGVLFLAVAVTIPRIVSYYNPSVDEEAVATDFLNTIVQVSAIAPNKLEVKKSVPAVKTKVATIQTKSDQLVNPKIVTADQAVQDIAKNTDNVSTTETLNSGSGIAGINAKPGSENGADTSPTIDLGNKIVSTAALDKLPEFPGGINKFYSYVGNNFEKPEIDNNNTIRIYVSFVIERDGSMTDIQVKRDPGFGLGKEAIRVLKSLRTKWSPGMIDGKAVRTSYNLPITIKTE